MQQQQQTKQHRSEKEEVETISITRLASKAGVDKSHISLILAGKRMPSLPVARRIADAMSITMDELYDRISA